MEGCEILHLNYRSALVKDTFNFDFKLGYFQ